MVREVYVKTVLNRHRRRDPWFLDDYSVNPYMLCDYNCVYCYVRGSRYGANMGESLAVKVNAPTILAKELRRRAERREHGFIALSSATEPWMNVEAEYEVTRKCLRVILRHRFPVHCLTKSNLILRDLDLLGELDERAILPADLSRLGRGVLITFSLSTLDGDVARLFEPGAPKPEERLETLRVVREEGFHAGVAYIPVLPFISDGDEQLVEMAEAARDYGACYVFFGALTLQGNCRRLYYRVLERRFPELLSEYERLFDLDGQPSREYQLRLERRAREVCRRVGVRYRIL